MEGEETERIAYYAHKLNDGHGDLTVLGPDERKHLKLLIQLYELETKEAELRGELGQLPLFPAEV